ASGPARSQAHSLHRQQHRGRRAQGGHRRRRAARHGAGGGEVRRLRSLGRLPPAVRPAGWCEVRRRHDVAAAVPAPRLDDHLTYGQAAVTRCARRAHRCPPFYCARPLTFCLKKAILSSCFRSPKAPGSKKDLSSKTQNKQACAAFGHAENRPQRKLVMKNKVVSVVAAVAWYVLVLALAYWIGSTIRDWTGSPIAAVPVAIIYVILVLLAGRPR